MHVSLFTSSARLALAAAALLLGATALFLRRRGAREAWVVLPTSLACAAVLVLFLEQAVALIAAAAAPEGAAFNEWRWVLLSPWGRGGIALGVLATLATLVLSFLGTARESSPWRRAALVGLRAGACAAALVLFLEPALELRHVKRDPNHIVVLVDRSLSMGLKENQADGTRAERARRVIQASQGVLEAWRRDHQVDFYAFAEKLVATTEAEVLAESRPMADATRLREALEQVRASYEGNDLAGIIVLSDGVPTGPFADGVKDGASRDFLHGLGTPVHTLWVGAEGLEDLAVSRILDPEFAFVHTAVKIEAVLTATGFSAETVPVTLKRDGGVVKQKAVTLGGATTEARVSFEFSPERIGKYVYEISVPVREGEAVAENNARSFTLRVIRDKIRVLQVAGRPSWDERALRGLFKSNPNVDLISFFILRTPEDIQLVPNDEMSLIPFPTEELFEEQLGSFDAVVLMNFEYAKYGIAPYLENLRKYVHDGGGLAMVGGDLAFSSGRYDGTPLAEALPVELLPSHLPPDRLVSLDEFTPHLTKDGLRHPITQLRFDARDNAARWNGLPPLEGVNLVGLPKSHATVLMTHPFLKAHAQAMPVLTVGDYGRGRALALGSDTAWHWGFRAAAAGADDGRAYQQFWENAVRWLIHDPELAYLHIETDRAEYTPSEAPRMALRLVDHDYRPAKGLPITVSLSRTADPAVLLTKKVTTDEDGQALLEIVPPGPGAFRAVARTTVAERPATADDVFLVHPAETELERPIAREDILQEIARTTGGKYLGAATVLDEGLTFAAPRVVRMDRRSDVELWSRPYVFFIALLLFATEWSLRRRSGYL